MIRKRLIGVVTVRAGLAVQSFGYSRYLPLGRAEVLVENLDRWGADEILVQCLDRTARGVGPDLELLDRISRKGISTPLIYAGGIRSVEDAVAVIKAGADRVCVDALLHDAPQRVADLAEPLGAQALIAALPLAMEDGEPKWLDYRCGKVGPLSADVLGLISEGIISEVLAIDWKHEGSRNGFDTALLRAFPLQNAHMIAFGGLGESARIRAVLEMSNTVAAAVGNSLNYREHAIQCMKNELVGLPLRAASYE